MPETADILSSTSQDTVKVATMPSKNGTGRRDKRRKRKVPGFIKWLVAIVIIGGIAGGVYLWKTQTDAAAEQTITVTLPVLQGDINTTVQSNGNIQASREEAVNYETTGDVVEVLVKPGDHVQAGQSLVRQTDADQKEAVSQAQVSLNTAQAKLDDLKKGASDAEIASAQADVQSAQAALDKVKAGATAKDIADAQADVRQAQTNLDTVKAGATAKEIQDAEADLKTAQTNYDTVKAGATAKEIQDAEADLKTAQANYDALSEPPSTSAVQAAQSQLDSAKAKLAALQAGPSATELSSAQLAVTQAENDLKGIQDDAALNKQEKELALAKADRDLEQAQRDYSQIANQVLNENGDLTVDASDPKYNQYWTAYDALKDAEAGQTQALAELDNVRQKEIDDVAAAQAKIDDANKQLAEVQAGATSEEVAAAQADVASAQKALDDLTAGPTKDQLATAEAAVVKARTTLDQLKAGPTADDLATAEAAVVKARTTLDQLKAGPTPDDLAQAQTALDKANNNLADLKKGATPDSIAAAQATLAQKQASLQALLEPASASDIAAAEQTVASAQKDLDDAQAELTKTVLTAPFSGVVASVSAEPNAKISVGTEAVTIYDESGMHIELAVNESDIQSIKEGQEASISIDALPNQVLTGTVSSVSLVSQSSQDVVTYQVDVQFNPQDLPIKTGMSASADIITESHPNVIEVPTRAIKTQGNIKTIDVLYNNVPVTVRVITGVTDGTMTEIVSCVETNSQCLRPGDQLSVTTTVSGSSSNSTSQQFPGGGFVQFGGGGAFPGPGTTFNRENRGTGTNR